MNPIEIFNFPTLVYMLRIKRRRTRPRCFVDGAGIRYNTMNATGLENVYENRNTYLDRIRQNPGRGRQGCRCETSVDSSGNLRVSYETSYLNDNGNIVNGCCKVTPYRNPILGYRKHLACSYSCTNKDGDMTRCSSDCVLKPTHTIYKDPYAKTCGRARGHDNEIGICYSPVIKKVQNRNGHRDNQYNYSFKQYRPRRALPCCKDADGVVTQQCALPHHGRPPAQSIGSGIYKPNNARFSKQGAVSGGSRINRLKYQTRLCAQSSYKRIDPVSSEGQTKCSSTQTGKKTASQSINVANGAYPAILYRDTYPTYKRNLSGFRHMNQTTFSGLRQRCHVDKKKSCKNNCNNGI